MLVKELIAELQKHDPESFIEFGDSRYGENEWDCMFSDDVEISQKDNSVRIEIL